jgi:RNA polymerase sigma factor (sigma-70 family)
MEVIRNLPEAEILASLRSGKKMDEAVRNLYRNYFDSLSWYVMNNSGNREDAEDVFQEVIVSFIDLVQKDKFRGESSIKTFLYSLNRYTWLNELKRRGRALAREERFEKEQDRVIRDPASVMAGRESVEGVIRLIEQLGEACKKILVLYYYENYSMKQILEHLNYQNEQVVRNKKYKCIKQLEELINNHPPLKQALKHILHE